MAPQPVTNVDRVVTGIEWVGPPIIAAGNIHGVADQVTTDLQGQVTARVRVPSAIDTVDAAVHKLLVFTCCVIQHRTSCPQRLGLIVRIASVGRAGRTAGGVDPIKGVHFQITCR
ncbi:hypothetical protein D3C76_1006820 [compost metagenome]